MGEFDQSQNYPPVTDFGWQKTDNGLRIIWHDYNSSVKTSKLLAIVTKTCQLSQLSPMNEQKCSDCVCSRSNMYRTVQV